MAPLAIVGWCALLLVMCWRMWRMIGDWRWPMAALWAALAIHTGRVIVDPVIRRPYLERDWLTIPLAVSYIVIALAVVWSERGRG